MNLQLIRYSMSESSTLGMLFIDGHFSCYTLEDAAREKKIPGETCIPAGIYGITLRTEGGQNHRYTQKFPNMHKGMLHLLNVPNFKYVYIHFGNTKEDTDGCILVGDGANNNQIEEGFVSSSVKAYQGIYKIIVDAIEDGEGVWIEIVDGIPAQNRKSQLTNAVVAANKLNLRKSPSGEVEGVLNQKTRTKVLESQDGWSKVLIEGWVAEEYLEES
ncbi:DUF5675 family protein [Marinifilum sp. D714]|uniref:DUF5675 family protein n=1 Tax=Marinifilum sp. D714 TaxID=2937523 RepID=UPI0027CDB6D8|nr:DUF5675 family protein [Marinifilum sp. D714]MDQ2177942.1 DUF5675 family protein [Marinifilum sp. D714]